MWTVKSFKILMKIISFCCHLLRGHPFFCLCVFAWFHVSGAVYWSVYISCQSGLNANRMRTRNHSFVTLTRRIGFWACAFVVVLIFFLTRIIILGPLISKKDLIGLLLFKKKKPKNLSGGHLTGPKKPASPSEESMRNHPACISKWKFKDFRATWRYVFNILLIYGLYSSYQ